MGKAQYAKFNVRKVTVEAAYFTRQKSIVKFVAVLLFDLKPFFLSFQISKYTMSTSSEEEENDTTRARTLVKLLIQGLACLSKKANSYTENDYPTLPSLINSGF